MAEISSLLTLQGQLALLTLIGFFLARKGIINAQGRKCLTDLLINVILPANIIQSFLVEFSWDVLKSSASILVISLALQIGCVVLCALGYNWLPFARRSVYQYGTVCSNGAFLGSALVDGIWGSSGLLQLHLPHPPACGNVVGGRELLSAGRKARFQRGDAGRPQGRAAENIHPPLHPGGPGGHGADGLSAAAARLFGPHRQEPEQLQHGCFHDPDRCHHRQQPDGQTLG